MEVGHPFIKMEMKRKVSLEENLVVLLDIFPTLLELAGLPADRTLDGISFKPLLLGEKVIKQRKDFLINYKPQEFKNFLMDGLKTEYPIWMIGQEIPEFQAIRTDRYLYVRWFHEKEYNGYHERELYDMKNDPWQLNNLIKNNDMHNNTITEENKNLIPQLESRIKELLNCSGASCY